MSELDLTLHIGQTGGGHLGRHAEVGHVLPDLPRRQAAAWLVAEDANLIASSVWAAGNGNAGHAARMADVPIAQSGAGRLAHLSTGRSAIASTPPASVRVA